MVQMLLKLCKKTGKRFWAWAQLFGAAGALCALVWAVLALRRGITERLERDKFMLAHNASFAQLSPMSRLKDWDKFRYVVIGGLRSSGASVLEQLLASQPLILGLGINSKIIANTSSCERPLRANPRHQCVSVENEGEAATRVFVELQRKRGVSPCKVGLSDRSTEFGVCAASLRLTESDWERAGPAQTLLRLRLFSDWAQFWFANGSATLQAAELVQQRSEKSNRSSSNFKIMGSPTPAPTPKPVNVYSGAETLAWHLRFNASTALIAAQKIAQQTRVLVEQEPANLVRSVFLQSLWGADKTAFVFTIRHPLAVPRCRYFKCNVVARLEAWLTTHEFMASDLNSLKRYIVVHYEGLTRNTASLVRHVHQVAWGSKEDEHESGTEWTYSDHTRAAPRNESGKPTTASAGVESAGQVETAPEKYSDLRLRVPAAKTTKRKKQHRHPLTKIGPGFTTTRMGTGNRGGGQMRRRLATSPQLKRDRVAASLHATGLATIAADKNAMAPTYLPGKYPYAVVSFRRTSEEEEWERDYRRVLQQPHHAEVVSQMQAFAKRLAQFCYSLDNLEVVINGCGFDHWKFPQYVWRQRGP